nr:hypothetical protein [Rhodopirellula sp. SM50]
MNDEQEIPFRLTVVCSRQSRYGGGSFSSCDAHRIMAGGLQHFGHFDW